MKINLQDEFEEQSVFIALRCYIDELYKDNTDPDDFLIVQPFIRAAENLIARYFPDEDQRQFIVGGDGMIHEHRRD